MRSLNRSYTFILMLVVIMSSALSSFSQARGQSWHYSISMQPDSQIVHVKLKLSGAIPGTLLFEMPVWTPGYYQFMNYAKNLSAFSATDENHKPLKWAQADSNSWRVTPIAHKAVIIAYNIKAARNFVAGNYLDSAHAFLSPAGIFLHLAGNIDQPVTVTIQQYPGWNRSATGLDRLSTDNTTYRAQNFDVLYDSPILMGKLEALPTFVVGGIPHDFIGYRMGSFDLLDFVANLKKIVAAGTDMFGDIPYNHYVFLAIGPGGGGIEHLNSAAVAFDGNGLNDAAMRIRLYSFLAHEYFHNFNVKRIRPIELGPFDYEHGNKTEMLWVSEGFTVYYEYLLIHRAGLTTSEQLLNALRDNLLAYETKPGHLFQSATQSSFDTWSDGPFGRTGDELNKTISYYDKGPLLGLMLDLKIRHETNNKKSMDDVMRILYHQYYQNLKRGFTPAEFQTVCEQTAGVPLKELFEYASTTKEVNYHKYFAYAGLSIDDTVKMQPGAWLGIIAQQKKDSLYITDVEWDSPAWKMGVRAKSIITSINEAPATLGELQELTSTKKAGDAVELGIVKNGLVQQIKIVLETHQARSFKISFLPHPDELQQAIYHDIFK